MSFSSQRAASAAHLARGNLDQTAAFARGDLGMGRGLKPGAISVNPDELDSNSSFTELYCSSRNGSTSSGGQHLGPDGRRDGSFQMSESSPDDYGVPESFPSYAGVPFGTSLQQHRKVYAASRKDLTPDGALKSGLTLGPDGDGIHSCSRWNDEKGTLASQLKIATEEVDTLQNELEVCQSHLGSKLRAIKILQHQASAVNSRFQQNEDKINAAKSGLEKEVNSLQFELDTKTTSLIRREETWSEKFNRVSLENTVLMSTLRARTEEVRRLHADKVALVRERGELLARMDANERLQYEHHWTTKNDQAYLQHTLSEQLAVLGACMCRGSHPEPCQCARIAAILTKETGCVKDEMERLKQKLVESVLVSDAFRKAFEEQLQCNSALLRKMADDRKLVGDGLQSGKKPFWHRKKYNGDDGAPPCRPVQVQYGLSSLPVTRSFEEQEHRDRKQRTVGLQVCQPIPDSSSVVEDLLSDKSEALAHQRLVSKLLAQKTQDLERAVKRTESLLKH